MWAADRRVHVADQSPGLRLYLTEAPHGDSEAVATVLEACHGFRAHRLPRTADGPCASASSARAAALAHVDALRGRLVVSGVTCAEEARFLGGRGFFGVAVASTPTPLVCAVAGPEWPWRREALSRPGRQPSVPECGHRVAPVRYLLDTGRRAGLARDHIATLVAVLETLRHIEGRGGTRTRAEGMRAPRAARVPVEV